MTWLGWLCAFCGFSWAVIVMVVVVADVTLLLTGHTSLSAWCRASFRAGPWPHVLFWALALNGLALAAAGLLCHLYGGWLQGD